MTGSKGLVASDDYIYVLFDTNRVDATERVKNEIWKFDWNGSLLAKLAPNANISLFTITPDERIIALTLDENPDILVWDTNSL